MSEEEKLNIQINVETEMPDIQISVGEETPEIEMRIEEENPDIQILMTSDGEEREIYSGSYEVDPRFFNDMVLETKDKIMTDDVTVKEIRIEKVSAPKGGYVYYIGL